MCGIAGVIGPGANAAGAEALIAPLTHRGPDGVRVEQLADAALAHARLSIIDLECGWQPLHAAGSTVIGNGEIYNYLELIEEYGLRNQLKTGSDFEPLLHIYAREGPRAFEKLRGMYAFCLIGHDGRSWLVRDPFGIKPLYTDRSGGRLRFASELRSLESPGPARALPEAELRELLALGYTVEARDVLASPAVPPGAVVEVTGGEPRLRSVTAPVPADPPPPPRDEAEALRRLDAVLEDSVRVHQRSDVPYGLFLSGGIDSAAIATLMARLNTRPVVAYTCGFPDAPGAADERRGAERIARALDLDWRETTFDEQDFLRIAPQVAAALDDPTTDYACLPTWKLAEAAKDSLTVVLSGEGGDELFAGYGRYRRALRPRWLGGRPAEPRVDAPYLPDGGAAALATWRAAAAQGRPPGLTPLQRAQWADIATWLPRDLLLKLDRTLMAHGLEGRTPFLDREVAAFAWSLPDGLKVRGRHGKWLLRRWLERACPAAEPWAKKQGFTVPVARWIAPRAAEIGPRVAQARAVRAACDPEEVRRLFADPRAAKHWWPLTFTALWSAVHLDGATAAEAGAAVWGGRG